MINPNKPFKVKGTITQVNRWNNEQYLFIECSKGGTYEGTSGRSRRDLAVGDQITALVKYSVTEEAWCIRETVKHRKAETPAYCSQCSTEHKSVNRATKCCSYYDTKAQESNGQYGVKTTVYPPLALVWSAH